MKLSAADGAGRARARSDLLHHVDAISLALKNWNDTAALKLLRLHWREIARAIQEADLRQGLPEGISVAGVKQDAVPSADDRISQFNEVDEIIDSSAKSGRISPSALRTSP